MEEVTTARMSPVEDERHFASHVFDASRICRHVFRPVNLINEYVQRLQTSTRARVQQQVRNLPLHESKNSCASVRWTWRSETNSPLSSPSRRQHCPTPLLRRNVVQRRRNRHRGQEPFVINETEAGASQILPVSSTPTRSLITDASLGALAPYSRISSYHLDCDPPRVVLCTGKRNHPTAVRQTR